MFSRILGGDFRIDVMPTDPMLIPKTPIEKLPKNEIPVLIPVAYLGQGYFISCHPQPSGPPLVRDVWKYENSTV